MPRILCGSSPRPWGTSNHNHHQREYRRFIPTPVGNITLGPLRYRSRTVHPHARGEHGCEWPVPSTNSGSSPRPWGTWEAGNAHGWSCRFIPTPVGNIGRSCRKRFGGTVHPHARGEHVLVRPRARLLLGSSPRPWGTFVLRVPDMEGDRFIPTPVGNILSFGTMVSRAAVHPHARGEHIIE